MRIRVYINNKEQILELFNVTYDVGDNRFKSLRLSKGHYPINAVLDYEDDIVEIREDFIVDSGDILKVNEYRTQLKTSIVNDVEVLKENWFCWNKGTIVSDIIIR